MRCPEVLPRSRNILFHFKQAVAAFLFLTGMAGEVIGIPVVSRTLWVFEVEEPGQGGMISKQQEA